MARTYRTRTDGSLAVGLSVYDPAINKTVWLGTFRNDAEANRAQAAYFRQSGRQPETFEHFADEWLAKQKGNLRPTTYSHYSFSLSHAKDHLGSMPLSEIGVREMEGFASHLTARLKPLTTRVVFDVTKRVLDAAARYGLIDSNPADRVKNLPRRKRDRTIRVLSLEEHAAFVAALPPFYRPLFGVWPLLGLRRGEMFGLRVTDITDTHAHVRQQFVRGRVSALLKSEAAYRSVPLLGESRRLIEAQVAQAVPNPLHLLFTTPQGSPLEGGYIKRKVVDPAIAESGIGGRLTFHDFRHTFASYSIAAGVNVKQLSALLGHERSQLTLDTYSHLMPSNDEDVIRRLEAFLD